MSAPQVQPAKTARRSNKKHRQIDNQDNPAPTTAGPVVSQPRNASPAAGTTAAKQNNKPHTRKQSSAPQKATSDGQGKGPTGGGGGGGGSGGNGNANHPKTQATPIKAYAGSNFQQSPAASALPLPSFYSKSLPTVGSLPSQPSTGERPTDLPPDGVSPEEASPTKRESTPLDFLFEAARNATKATPRDQSPAARSGNLSVPAGSPASRSPAPRDGDSMFPFELEGGVTPGEDGSAFSTPYKDRMEAFKATRSSSMGAKSLDENERRAKTDALKSFLMKSSGQPLGPPAEMNNPFNARPANPSPMRHSSGPPTPGHVADFPQYNYASQGYPPNAFQFPSVQHQTPKRPPSSRLRNVYGAQSEPEYAELSSDNAITPPISTARRHTPQSYAAYDHSGYQSAYAPQPQIPGHRAKPSAQQLEDDLRRVLKLDLISKG